MPIGEAEEIYFLVKARQGEKNRYRFNRKILKLEEVLPEELTYPENYGIVIKTHCDDTEPLDGFVLLKESPPVGSLVKVKPIGFLRIKEENKRDEKIICVALEDEDFSAIEDIEQISNERQKSIKDFFETYGYLNDKEIKIEGWFGKERSKKLIEHSRKLYKRKAK